MIDFSQVFAILMMIVPGFIATGTMTFVLGIRKQEWNYALIWSIVFSIFSYTFMFLISSFLSLNTLYLYTKNLEDIKNISDLINLVIPSSIISIFIGYLTGNILKSSVLKKYLSKNHGKTLHLDIWMDFFENRKQGKILILLKNGNSWYGDLEFASDHQSNDFRGIVLKNPIYVEKSLENSLNGVKPRTANIYGTVLIYYESIENILAIDDKKDNYSQQKK